jgi:lysophospholipase L1-like esterase
MGGTNAAGGGGAAPSTNAADAGAPPPRADAGAAGAGGSPAYPPSAGKPTIYVAGDSTVSTYTPAQAPQQGWGQRLQEFFTTDVTVVNRAIGGRSSKSFIDEGHLTEILNVIKPGDYLFAQWGINDRSVAGPDRATDPATTFRTYLEQYIDGARSKNAIPVLVTPTPRHQFVNGVFQNGFQAYCDAILAVGTETNTPVIDLQAKGLAYYTMIGDAMVSSVISLDALHFKAEGAYQMARLVAQGVEELGLPISPFVMQSKLLP